MVQFIQMNVMGNITFISNTTNLFLQVVWQKDIQENARKFTTNL